MSLDARVRVRRGAFDLDVALDAEDGEVIAVLGPNGSGKTTALHTLAGLIPHGDSTIRVGGRIWADGAQWLGARQRHTGLVTADHLLFPHLSALDNVAFGPRSRGTARHAARARAAHELTALGVGEAAARRPSALSHGQAQRVALARALATDPQLLLLDEPLAALDPATRAEVRSVLGQRLTAYGGTTVIVTHDPLDALTLADRLVFVEGGRVVQTGTPGEVVARPRDPYVARVVGLNLLHGEAGDGAHVRIGDLIVVTAEHGHRGPSWVAFAPSAVSIFPARPDGSPRNTWQLRVAGVELLGQSARVRLTGALDLVAEITAVSVAQLRLQPGDEVWASLKATEVIAYPA